MCMIYVIFYYNEHLYYTDSSEQSHFRLSIYISS
jgi:hypothetical protein